MCFGVRHHGWLDVRGRGGASPWELPAGLVSCVEHYMYGKPLEDDSGSHLVGSTIDASVTFYHNSDLFNDSRSLAWRYSEP
jgi:hypothetical protein